VPESERPTRTASETRPVRRFAYPVSLELAGRGALVVGELAVAHGKAEALADAGAAVTVVAQGPAEVLDRLERDGRVTVRRRPFAPSDLDGMFLCVASSPDPAARAALHREARARQVLLNVMDDPQHCDFAAPAVVRRGDLAIAVSTGGRSPALASRLREQLERRYGPEWAALLDLLAEVRAQTAAALPDVGERIRRWRAALRLDELEALLRDGRREEARRRLLDRLTGKAAGGEAGR
jgi:siroheme synthase-like protein